MTASRISQVRGRFMRRCDAMLVTGLTNVRYLTGFSGTAGALLVTGRSALFLTDFRYATQAAAQVKSAKVLVTAKPLLQEAVAQANRRRIARLGFESHLTTVADANALKKGLTARLVPLTHVVEDVRLRKDESEVDRLRRAVLLADAAFTHILDTLRPGVREIEIAAEIEYFLRCGGAAGPSFETIVASGPRSALPHGVASDRVVRKNEFVVLDFGALLNGYCSDLTRTVFVGKPTRRHRDVYRTVWKAQQTAEDGLRAGRTGREVDALAREQIRQAGFGEYFGHGLGHGVGMEIHEGPRLSQHNEKTLEAGNIVTAEPGIYIPEWGGVRIEDMCVVRHDGAEVLTRAAKPEEVICL